MLILEGGRDTPPPVDNVPDNEERLSQPRGGHAAREPEDQVPRAVRRVEGRTARTAGVVINTGLVSDAEVPIAVYRASSPCSGSTICLQWTGAYCAYYAFYSAVSQGMV
jgi:hypothetical protein